MRWMGWMVVVGWLSAAPAWAGRWTEDDFLNKALRTEPYAMVASKDPARANTMIGSVRQYTPVKGDTFLDLARFYGLGFNEIEQANPGIDQWIPALKTSTVTLPTAWIIPQGPHIGVVVNIPEMRLYYFHPHRTGVPQLVTTYPVGLGRDEWRTPQGKFKVLGKTQYPTWVIPESIRREHIKERGDHRRVIKGGAPDNPLGKYRLELTMPGYRIHGTDIPWGVGMQVSHGCVRLYPEDIEVLYPLVPIGAPGEFLYRPVKIGARDGRIYAEVSPDIYKLLPDLFGEAQGLVVEHGWQQWVDVEKLRRAVETQDGIPTDVTVGEAPLTPANGAPRPGRREPL